MRNTKPSPFFELGSLDCSYTEMLALLCIKRPAEIRAAAVGGQTPRRCRGRGSLPLEQAVWLRQGQWEIKLLDAVGAVERARVGGAQVLEHEWATRARASGAQVLDAGRRRSAACRFCSRLSASRSLAPGPSTLSGQRSSPSTLSGPWHELKLRRLPSTGRVKGKGRPSPSNLSGPWRE